MSIQQILLGIGGGDDGPSWIMSYLGPTRAGSNPSRDNIWKFYADVNGNINIAARQYSDYTVTQFDKEGTFKWRSWCAAADKPSSMAGDSDGNIFVGCYGDLANETGPFLVKYNQSGTIIAQKTFGTNAVSGSANSNNRFQGLAVDNNDKVHGFIAYSDGSDWHSSFTKCDNDLTNWSYNNWTWEQSNGDGYPYFQLAVDNSGRRYAYTHDADGRDYPCLANFNSDGTMSGTDPDMRNAEIYGLDLTLNPSTSTAYMCGYKTSTGSTGSSSPFGYRIWLAKYSWNTLSWQREYRDTYDLKPFDVGVDSDDNAYIVGSRDQGNQGSGNVEFPFIMKINSSGVHQWTRVFAGSNLSETGESFYNVSVRDNHIYARSAGKNSSGTEVVIVVRYPTDGSITGTFGDWTISSATWTPITQTPTYGTSVTGSATIQTQTLSAGTDTATFSTETPTSSIQTIS